MIKSYYTILQVIEALQDCIQDQKQLIKNCTGKRGFEERNDDHFELNKILSNSLNCKFEELIKDRDANEISESEFKRHLIKFKQLLNGDIMLYAPVLHIEKINEECQKYFNNSEDRINTIAK